ncbi:carboxylesterase [Pseudomassariella vexata]|uniref:Carboxylic ester hydrolase n=1 Tax=Pseudomassariella vexata TaxID=1141098 RepID=A0A1Y2DSH8_9PEZI|nr:carboxylesterase [Pseudomassariella vexata]ORY62210.1 carboxylesterase [Pseudomassariella vexata]
MALRLGVLVSVWLAVFAARLAAAEKIKTVATLDYGTFQGAYSAQYGISYWQKIPFAAPPIGENRFRALQPPLPITNGTYDSLQPFDMCPQRTVNGSEDCLYLGLYGRPWSEGQPLRPVVVTFYGGAFIQGSAYFTIPPSAYPILNVSESSDMMFVYPNYRVNAFGFLPGREVAEDPKSDVNAGLLDQQMVLKWTQKYIKEFGGDPNHVSIWGQSAGGGSVVAQVIARKHNPPLFEKALASSPFWPKTYRNEDPESQARYDMLASLTDCTGPDSLKCLKSLDVQTLRNASLIVGNSHTYNTTSYSWGPIIDGEFLTQPLSAATAANQSDGSGVNIQLAFSMYNTHEGENFIPAGLRSATNSGSPPFNSSAASFDGWLRGYLPNFSEADLAQLKVLYPENGSSEAIGSYSDSYTRTGLVYRDSVLACPAYWMAGAGAALKGGWLGEYTISPATHASDVYWWNTVNSAQQTDPLHYQGYAGAFASYFMTGDPNALKLTAENVTGVPPLKSGQEFVVNAQGFSTADLTQFKERCDFWRTHAPKVPI